MLQSRSQELESRESKVFTGSQSRSRKKDFAGVESKSRTEINPWSQSWSWSRTEKKAASQSRSQS